MNLVSDAIGEFDHFRLLNLPALGLKIRINYTGCILLCPHCYRLHPRGNCKNAKLTWIGYVHRFIQNNPTLDPQAYGRWWAITMREFPNVTGSITQTEQNNNNFLVNFLSFFTQKCQFLTFHFSLLTIRSPEESIVLERKRI